MLAQMLHVIGGMKDVEKLGTLLGAAAKRIGVLTNTPTSQVLLAAAQRHEWEEHR